MHTKKQILLRKILKNWNQGIKYANQDEIDKFITIRYYRKLIRIYNLRMYKELNFGIMLRKKLLKKYLFWILKQNV